MLVSGEKRERREVERGERCWKKSEKMKMYKKRTLTTKKVKKKEKRKTYWKVIIKKMKEQKRQISKE